MIGLERGITYDDEAHTQWAVSRHAWNHRKIHIHHEAYYVCYLKDVLVLEFWLLIS